MTAPRRFTCANCAAYWPNPNRGNAWGDCRRRSPSAKHDARWPVVGPEEWCLEYVPDEPTTAAIVASAEKRVHDAIALAQRGSETKQ